MTAAITDTANQQDAPAVSPPAGNWSVRGWAVRLLPALIPMALFIVVGIRGIDFGVHWDEQDHTQSVHDSLQNDIYLPMGGHAFDHEPGLKGGYYGYPSVIYWITLFSATPEIIRNHKDLASPQMLDFINGHEFLLRVRVVCLVISSLTIAWLYVLVLCLRLRVWPALLAGFLVAGSWELGYHSRWLATDMLATQFTALCLMFCVLTLQSRRGTFRLIRLGAVAAGLAAGTKYPAGMLILPVIFTALVASGNKVRLWRRPLQIIELAAIFAAVFLLTTPGALLQPLHFFSWLQYDREHYRSVGHGVYNILSHSIYLRTTLIYLGMVLFSRYAVVSLILAGMGFAGAVALFPRQWKLAAVLLVVPAIFVGYFSQQIVFICRNLLLLAPFLVVLSAVGADVLYHCVPRLWWRCLVGSILAACVIVNTLWVVYAAESIHRSLDPAYEVNQLADYLQGHPNTQFYVTPGVNELLAKYHRQTWPLPPANVQPDYLVTHRDDSGWMYFWPANKHDSLWTWFGPYEVNLNYYPDFMRPHIYLIPYRDALALDPARAILELLQLARDINAKAGDGFKLAAYLDCGPQTVARTDDLVLYQSNGKTYQVPFLESVPLSFSTEAYAEGDLVFKAELNRQKQYRVGLAWWDFHGSGWVQSVYVGGAGIDPLRVVDPQPLPRWLNTNGKPPQPAAEVTFAIPPEVSRTGEADIFIRGATPNATTVVSDIWIMEKPSGSRAP